MKTWIANESGRFRRHDARVQKEIPSTTRATGFAIEAFRYLYS